MEFIVCGSSQVTSLSNKGVRLPRTEIRITGYDYSLGVWQFEGHAYVPKGTSGVTIVQIHVRQKGPHLYS